MKETLAGIYGKHFLTLKDFTAEEICAFLDLAAELKRRKKAGIMADEAAAAAG